LTPAVDGKDHVLGREEAPITLVQYGDFECPFSGKAFLSVKKLQESLPDEFRFVYRHFPIIPKHKHAQQAAEASEAAAAQGRFWEYHDILYNHQTRLAEKDLIKYARDLGLDSDRFRQQLTAREFEARVTADQRGGEEGGVYGTPTFFINGSIYEGYYEYRELYEALLKESRAKE
jgi:formate-nitrite transporter family protein